VEPWYDVARLVAIPPVKLWFNWRFEDLDRIPRTGPAIVAANRISYLDPFADGYAVMKAGRRPRFLAKEELFTIPVVGRVIRGAHQIPVKRGSGDPAPLIRASEALEAGEAVVIYPEGTVTKNPDFLPMKGKTGAVRLSVMSGVPITPLATWGGQAVWQKSGKGSLKFGRPIWLKAGEPIDFGDRADQVGDREALHEMTDELMSALTVLALDLRSRYPKRWTDEG
jgi:1-acyl-sn-glycerol-3-phosphate acyltransferase